MSVLHQAEEWYVDLLPTRTGAKHRGAPVRVTFVRRVVRCFDIRREARWSRSTVLKKGLTTDPKKGKESEDPLLGWSPKLVVGLLEVIGMQLGMHREFKDIKTLLEK